MTKSQLLMKLNQAQELLHDIYDWVDSEGINGRKVNTEVADLISLADGCIIDAFMILDN